MNIAAELQRIWGLDAKASKLLPPEKLFTGQAPDQIEDGRTGKQIPVNAPYGVFTFEDGLSGGGTNLVVEREFVFRFSAYGVTRIQAEIIRDHARHLFHEQRPVINGPEQIQDIQLETDGEEDPVDGVFEVFQRFAVQTVIERPRR